MDDCVCVLTAVLFDESYSLDNLLVDEPHYIFLFHAHDFSVGGNQHSDFIQVLGGGV